MRHGRDVAIVETHVARPLPAQLNESDAILWHIERDPALRTTVVAVALLDRAPDASRLRARLLEATELVPRLRQRIVDAPLHIGPPRWVDDDRFDLDYHLRRISAPSPGDLRAVLDLAAPMVMAAFDKDRPLWEFTLVEGMQGGGAAFIQKFHHAFVDGVGGVALARLLLDETADPTAPTERARPVARGTGAGGTPRSRGGPSQIVQALQHQARGAAVASWRIGRIAPGLSVRLLRHPVGAVESSARTLRSIGKLVAPVTDPLSPVMRERGLGRRLDAFELPMERFETAAHAAGCTVNDAFLAAVAGGMRRYHERHGDVPSRLRVTMPINLRCDDDDPGGNRFAPARFAIPITTEDPVASMRALGRVAREWRDEPAVHLNELIAGSLNRLPVAMTTAIFGSLLKAIDIVATNVPGVRERAYLAGAEVLREYAFAPPSGAACSVALLSHGHQCCIGITVDTVAVPDPEVLTECLRAGFDEVVAVGTVTPPSTRTPEGRP
jgi:diacylglycerol O-acyltransferase